MTKSLVGAFLLVLPAVAAAEDNGPATGPAPDGALVTEVRPDGVILARKVVAGSPVETPDGEVGVALAQSRYIYLNKNGTALSPGGSDNSASNVSTIVPNNRNFPAWNVSAADWNIVRSAVQEMFAPFGVTVSDSPPPAGTRHVEALFGGGAGDALPASQVPPPEQGYILGVSPFTIDCGIIEDSIVFTFAEDAEMLGISMREIAEIAAQEIAHSYGLDHVLNASDPMTYLPYTGNRSFKAGAVQCGEDTPRACGLVNQGYPSCRPNQDSVALLTERIGTGGGNPGDVTAPDLSITAPEANATVPPGFSVYANADDDNGVVAVELYIDGVLADSTDSTPYRLQAPDDLNNGEHEVKVIATDGIQETEDLIYVIVDDDADPVEPPDDGGDGGEQYVTGGCSTGTGAGGGLALAGLVGLALATGRRRRRH